MMNTFMRHKIDSLALFPESVNFLDMFPYGRYLSQCIKDSQCYT